jgi:hypothetical protein
MVRDQIAMEQPDLLDNIIWSDEACFKLSGHVNRHNCMYWADENPHFTIMSQLNQPGVHCPAKVLSYQFSLMELWMGELPRNAS